MPRPIRLYEDEPLPAANNTLNATTATFNSVYAAAAAGDHIVLANGSYGAKTLNRSFSASNRLVIRAANLLGATFTTLTISGNGQIVSGVTVNPGSADEGERVVSIDGSNIRVTRSEVVNGAQSFNFGAGVTDILIDHCEDRGAAIICFGWQARKTSSASP